MEILYKSVENDANIEGISVQNKEIKYTAFADDATFLLNGNKSTFESLINLIDKFGTISGLKLNINKSIVLRVGSLKYSVETFCNNKKFVWTNDRASTLGIVFTNDKNKNIDLNYNPKLEQFQNCLEIWKKHKMSIIGKITVIKTFALPKLIFPLTVLETPNINFINSIKNKMFEFLWEGKPDKIKRKTIIQNIENGGLKMIDIELFINSLKASWVKRLTDDSNKGGNLYICLYLNKTNYVPGPALL